MTPSEEIDRTLSVTSARGWIALLATLLVAAAIGIWSVVGEVATYVDAHGFLLNRDGKVVDAAADGRGRLGDFAVAVGDEVEKGAFIAALVNEELAERYAGALALVEERQLALDALKAAIAEETRIVDATNARRRKHLDEFEAAALSMLETARSNFENSQELFKKGAVTRLRLERSQQEFNAARRALLDLGRDQDALEVDEVRRGHDNARRIREMESRIQAAERQARELEPLLAAVKILAPASGQVIEFKAAPGAIMQPGYPVASIRTGAEKLEALLYVKPDDGKRVEPGMQALVSPVGVKREEFGAIRGRVVSLSPFPVSLDGMVAVLQNRSLAQSFSTNGPPYAGRIALEPDPTTASGFAWTSPKASDHKLTAGTLASVEIKTRSQPPITLAVPLLKELLGL